MQLKTRLDLAIAALRYRGAADWSPARLSAQTLTFSIDNDNIGGVVTGPNGPEAGVWVIAETTDLPTRYTKSVVTDDQGRYVIPDLPIANYKVWVRGYGLVNSPKMRAKPGQSVNHRAVPAPNDAAGGPLLSGDLLVHDDENSTGKGFRWVRPRSRRKSRGTSGASA